MSDKCPVCGADEVDAYTPRTVYACGSSDYDSRPGTLKVKCGEVKKLEAERDALAAECQESRKFGAELHKENQRLQEYTDKIDYWIDQIGNGIKEHDDGWILCWTKKQIDNAKQKAEELSAKLKQALEQNNE